MVEDSEYGKMKLKNEYNRYSVTKLEFNELSFLYPTFLSIYLWWR